MLAALGGFFIRDAFAPPATDNREIAKVSGDKFSIPEAPKLETQTPTQSEALTQTPSASPGIGKKTPGQTALILEPSEIYEKSRIAIATIKTKDSADQFCGQGSGVFIDVKQIQQLPSNIKKQLDWEKKQRQRHSYRSGYLLTNYHVIRGAASAEIELEANGIKLSGESRSVLIESEKLDLAILEVMLTPPFKPDADFRKTPWVDLYEWAKVEERVPWWTSHVIPTLEIERREDPPIGHTVYAIGSPQGLKNTLSEGLVSGYRKENPLLPQMQFTAPISPGSSGGALLNAQGRMVGIVTATHLGGQNLNFAVPASGIQDFLNQPCNEREIWRGASIEDELKDAIFSMLAVDLDINRSDITLTKEEVYIIWSGCESSYDWENPNGDKLENIRNQLNSIDAESCGEFAYLLHFARGCNLSVLARRDIEVNNIIPEEERHLSLEKYLKLAFQRNANNEASILAFNKAIQINPTFSPSLSMLHSVQERSGRHEQALQTAELLLQLVPQCSQAYRIRGDALANLNHYELAANDYKTGVALRPRNETCYSRLAKCYSKLDLHEKSIEAFESAIELGYGEGSAVILVDYAFELQRVGRFRDAISIFEKAREEYLAISAEGPAKIMEDAIAECREFKRE